jgi:hypothetical protein
MITGVPEAKYWRFRADVHFFAFFSTWGENSRHLVYVPTAAGRKRALAEFLKHPLASEIERPISRDLLKEVNK